MIYPYGAKPKFALPHVSKPWKVKLMGEKTALWVLVRLFVVYPCLFVPLSLIFPSEYHLFIALYLFYFLLDLFPVLRSHPFDWFEPPVYWFLFLAINHYRPFYLMIYKNFHSDFLPTASKALNLELAIKLVLIFIFFCKIPYLIGYYGKWGWKLGFRKSKTSPLWDWQKLLLWMTFGMVLAILCFFAIVSVAGDPINYFLHINYYRRVVALKGLVSFRRGLILLPFVMLLGYAYYLTQKRKKGFKVYILISLILALFVGGRSFVILPIMGMLVLNHYLLKPISFKKMMFYAFGILAFMVFFQNFRGATGDITGPEEIEKEEVKTAVFSQGLNPIKLLNAAIQDRRSFDERLYRIHTLKIPEDLLLGSTYLYYLVWYIPRSIWHGKVKFGFKTKPQLIHAQPAGYFGELYQNFYLPGLLLGFFLWGIIHRALYAWLKANPGNKSVLMLYMVTLVWMPGPDRVAVLGWLPIYLFTWVALKHVQIPWHPGKKIAQQKVFVPSVSPSSS